MSFFKSLDRVRHNLSESMIPGLRKVRRKVKVGKKIKRSLFGSPISSAGSYAYQRGEYYGPTGSIVGRY